MKVTAVTTRGVELSGTESAPRRRREVVSFARRSARFNAQQQKAWHRYADRWVVDVPRLETDTSIDPGFSLDLGQVFSRTAPLIVEIGPGMGESLVSMAAARPEANVLAFEVFLPAVAGTLGKLGKHELANVRLVQANAVEGLTTLVPAASMSELWLFFPDPWPKHKHHKRRLVTPEFADLVACRMAPGGIWRMATDWAGYATRMRSVLDGHAAFANEHPGGWAPRLAARPMTRFESRGIAAGRRILDLTFRRV